VRIQSQESKNISKHKMAISIIKEQGPINRFKLAVKLGMTPRSYQVYHGFLKEAYDHIVEYDNETKLWSMVPIEKPVIEEQEEFDSDEMEKEKDESMPAVSNL